jgi:signal transduction histidine kinase
MMRSLRQRAILSGLALSVLSILVGAFLLVTRVDEIAMRRFDTELAERHLQLVVALASPGEDADAIAAQLTNPLYDRPYSGQYWQVSIKDGPILTSRSLFDATLDVPEASADLRFGNGSGPDGDVRLAWRRITQDDGSALTVAVASSLSQFYAERWEVRKSMLAAFAIIGLLGLIIAVLQTSAVLRPLTTLRDDINKRWNSGETLDPTHYPEEVSPLVQDINTLLNRNRDILEQTRLQGADLAHALKTPSAILRNDLLRLSANGQDTKIASDALDRIDAQINRSLARVRAANLATPVHLRTNLRNSASRLARLFESVPENADRTLQLDVPADLNVSMDMQDLEEVLGNLIENALKFCKSRVVVSATPSATSAVIRVEDDGPGIPADDRKEAMRAGGRLDTASSGTGLGLAIASDVVRSYGGTLNLSASPSLGGLAVEIVVPTRLGL